METSNSLTNDSHTKWFSDISGKITNFGVHCLNLMRPSKAPAPATIGRGAKQKPNVRKLKNLLQTRQLFLHLTCIKSGRLSQKPLLAQNGQACLESTHSSTDTFLVSTSVRKGRKKNVTQVILYKMKRKHYF